MILSADELGARVERVLDKGGKKHVGLAVGVREGETTYTTGRGRVAADRLHAPGERTIFEIGSITKVFTATLLADMAREGLVALDDPVQRYLPEGVELPVRGRPITLGDLASHTSGLPRLPKGLLWHAIRESANPYANFTHDQLETAIPRTKPRRPPGKTIRYSNHGAGLLGFVLALRAGQPYEQLVAERITGPLAMSDTSIAVPEGKLDRFAQGHSRRGRPVSNWDLPALAGAGALRSTVADVLTFLTAQLGDAPEPLAEAIRMTHEPRARRGVLGVGLGWLMLPVRDRPYEVVWHDGGTGGFRSVAGFVAEVDTAIVVLANSSRPVDNLGLEILNAMSEPVVD